MSKLLIEHFQGKRQKGTMDNSLFISIIVPAYNAEKTIGQCIESFLGQDYPKDKYEIIIVDNNSKDKTAEITKKYPVKYVLENKIQSSYAARNTGARIGKGDVFAFSDADCTAEKNWLYEINNSFIDKNLSAVQGPGNLSLQQDLKIKVECLDREMSKIRFWGDTKNFAIRKEIFNKTGGFDNFYTGCDGLFFFILKFKKYNIMLNKNMVVFHSFPATFFSLFKKNWKHGIGDVFIAKKFYRIDRKKKFKEMLFMQQNNSHKILSLQVKLTEKIYMLFYYFFMKEVRCISYLVHSFDG